jgi:hypothetical protein
VRRWTVTFTDMDDRTQVVGRVRAFTKLGAQLKALVNRPQMFCFSDITRG